MADTRTFAGTQAVWALSRRSGLHNACLYRMAVHSADDIANAMPPEYALGNKEVYIQALAASREMYSRDGRFVAAAAKTAYQVLKLFDQSRMRRSICPKLWSRSSSTRRSESEEPIEQLDLPINKRRSGLDSLARAYERADDPCVWVEKIGADGRTVRVLDHEFGSKSMSGYFVEQAATCRVTLMIIERSEPEKSLPPSPTLVRLVLSPGQIAGLDSEEGQSLNFTCGEDAKTLLVDAGEKAKLVALQSLTLPKDVAKFGVGIGPAKLP